MKIRNSLLLLAFAWGLSGCNKCEHPVIRCELIPDAGPCEALIKKYFFNQATGKCEEFDWGGCGGVVPFDTMEECKECCE